MSAPRYRSVDELARKLVHMSVNLTPPAFVALPAARALVARVLRCCFLPLAHLDGGAREHAFWSACATLHGLAQQKVPEGAERIALDDSDVTTIYRQALERHKERLSADEAAFLARLGMTGVFLIDKDDPTSETTDPNPEQP